MNIIETSPVPFSQTRHKKSLTHVDVLGGIPPSDHEFQLQEDKEFNKDVCHCVCVGGCVRGQSVGCRVYRAFIPAERCSPLSESRWCRQSLEGSEKKLYDTLNTQTDQWNHTVEHISGFKQNILLDKKVHKARPHCLGLRPPGVRGSSLFVSFQAWVNVVLGFASCAFVNSFMFPDSRHAETVSLSGWRFFLHINKQHSQVWSRAQTAACPLPSPPEARCVLTWRSAQRNHSPTRGISISIACES